jgi:hypothetical protein
MAPVTRRRGNHFSTMHDTDNCDELVHEDQLMTKGDNEEFLAAMRIQIEDLTAQLAESRLYDRHLHRTPPWQAEEEDKDDDNYVFTNPFAELMLIGGRAGSNWIF